MDTSQAGYTEAKTSTGTRAKERMKEQGAKALRDVGDSGKTMLEEQKHYVCTELHHYSTALRRAAESLYEEDDERVASVAETIAENVDRASDYLESRPIETLYRDAEEFARRRPEWVLGGLFVAGLILGRFLKASQERRLAKEYQEPSEAEFTSYHETPTPAYAGSRPATDLYGETPLYEGPRGGMEG